LFAMSKNKTAICSCSRLPAISAHPSIICKYRPRCHLRHLTLTPPCIPQHQLFARHRSLFNMSKNKNCHRLPSIPITFHHHTCQAPGHHSLPCSQPSFAHPLTRGRQYLIRHGFISYHPLTYACHSLTFCITVSEDEYQFSTHWPAFGLTNLHPFIKYPWTSGQKTSRIAG
jgi:hypothetical protein